MLLTTIISCIFYYNMKNIKNCTCYCSRSGRFLETKNNKRLKRVVLWGDVRVVTNINSANTSPVTSTYLCMWFVFQFT